MNQLKSVYNIPFLDLYPHPIHTCLSMIASNVLQILEFVMGSCLSIGRKYIGLFKKRCCILFVYRLGKFMKQNDKKQMNIVQMISLN